MYIFFSQYYFYHKISILRVKPLQRYVFCQDYKKFLILKDRNTFSKMTPHTKGEEPAKIF